MHWQNWTFVSQFYVEDVEDVDPKSKLRLIVPNSSCGGIIGKGGANIKYECCSFLLSVKSLLWLLYFPQRRSISRLNCCHSCLSKCAGYHYHFFYFPLSTEQIIQYCYRAFWFSYIACSSSVIQNSFDTVVFLYFFLAVVFVVIWLETWKM